GLRTVPRARGDPRPHAPPSSGPAGVPPRTSRGTGRAHVLGPLPGFGPPAVDPRAGGGGDVRRAGVLGDPAGPRPRGEPVAAEQPRAGAVVRLAGPGAVGDAGGPAAHLLPGLAVPRQVPGGPAGHPGRGERRPDHRVLFGL